MLRATWLEYLTVKWEIQFRLLDDGRPRSPTQWASALGYPLGYDAKIWEVSIASGCRVKTESKLYVRAKNYSFVFTEVSHKFISEQLDLVLGEQPATAQLLCTWNSPLKPFLGLHVPSQLGN